ncbi:MAG: DNA helicase [Bacilli bacterium]
MINEIKKIIENYLNNIKLCSIVIATVTRDGVKLTDKLTIPFDFVTGNLKKSLTEGKKVRLLRNLGGQEFFILEVIE